MLPHSTALRIEPLAPFFGVAIILNRVFRRDFASALRRASEMGLFRKDAYTAKSAYGTSGAIAPGLAGRKVPCADPSAFQL